MDSEPVKVKMTLRRAQPSVQGATTTPAAAAAVEAVEARWRAEEKKEKTEKRKKRFTGCLSWIVILVAAAGAAWYFLGEKYLPPEYTFPAVWQKIKEWQSPPPSRPEQTNPVNIRTAAKRDKTTS